MRRPGTPPTTRSGGDARAPRHRGTAGPAGVASYNGATELERGLDILLAGLTTARRVCPGVAAQGADWKCTGHSGRQPGDRGLVSGRRHGGWEMR
ncbi:hypothetical protein FCI23_54930 [Actinacidiphila oryziradicis]|uniref:Uncharacterized protein n=1 Tax=Actinacidiphila oryziradicis TaxID=2571141 RepID=A0A4U0RBW9_9ACTN|nr:hypothetical protein FCI23_54930 [Actinacidiphila oryziradicis]